MQHQTQPNIATVNIYSQKHILYMIRSNVQILRLENTVQGCLSQTLRCILSQVALVPNSSPNTAKCLAWCNAGWPYCCTFTTYAAIVSLYCLRATLNDALQLFEKIAARLANNLSRCMHSSKFKPNERNIRPAHVR